MMFKDGPFNHTTPTCLGAGLARKPNDQASIFFIYRYKNDFFAGTAERHNQWLRVFVSFELHQVEFFPWAAPILLDIIDYALGRLPKEG
jgi:hypothetical protein